MWNDRDCATVAVFMSGLGTQDSGHQPYKYLIILVLTVSSSMSTTRNAQLWANPGYIPNPGITC